MNFPRISLKHLFLVALLIPVVACDRDDDDDPTPNPVMKEPDPTGMSLGEYFQSLPSWDEFANNAPVRDAAPTGATGNEVSETVDVPQIQEDGSIDTLYNVTYTCQEVPYSMTTNPEQLVMYSPDVEILWPGALIQGKSHKDPIGGIRGLVINERDSINVSIPSLPTGQNFRRVKPNQATVSSAIGDIIGSATADGLSTPSSIFFSMESYHSEKQMALGMKLSGKYLGYSGSASGNINRNKSETTVTVQFFQKMYEVVVEPPQTPAGFFSEEFSNAKLQEQIDLGRMGANNLPVYVSNVVYGRMMMFSLTSTASESDIRAMLNVAYSNIGTNVKASMTAKQKTILESSKIAITSLGGDADATIAMIRSGNWQDYFTSSAPLSSAAPLSYTFRNLGDGSIAAIHETDEFTISSCSEKVGVPGVFDFLPEQTASLGDISFPVEIDHADFNGDGLEDLLLNHKQGSVNQLKIGYGLPDGGIDFQPSVISTEAPAESWQNFTTHIANLNGDQYPDLVWNNLLPNENITYFALNNGNNTFSFQSEISFPGNGWDKYDLLIGDVDNDSRQEVVFNITNNCCTNRTYIANLSQDASTLDYSQPFDISGTWGTYKPKMSNVNGGGDDLIFNALTGGNGTYVALSNNDTTFTLSSFSRRTQTGWGNYEAYPGNADNNTNSDLIFNNVLTNPINRVYVNLSNGDGSYSMSSGAQDHPVSQNWSSYKTLIGDVNGDGIDDICWTPQKAGQVVTDVFVGLGTNSGMYDFSPVRQEHPYQEAWSQYSIQLMDLNGDDKQDLLWIKPGSTTTFYTALAK